MVSKPEPALSVVSRCSRQSRKRRSLISCAQNLPRNEFPVFSDTGDIEILVSTGGKTNRYMLHRIILSQCSKYFLASTSNECWKDPSEISRSKEEGGERNQKNVGRWRYELDMGDGVHDVPVLVQRNINRLSTHVAIPETHPPPVHNKPGYASLQSLSRSESIVSHQSLSSPSYLCKEAAGLRQAYHNLFLIFYNYPPELDSSCISRAYHESKALLSLADLYDALPVVGPRIEHHLLRFQSTLWRHIAKYPASYLHLGYFTKSYPIFQEAFVHVLGLWPEIECHIRERLPPCVTKLMQDKFRDLSELVRRVEIELWSLTLHTTGGKRVTPQNSYLDWLVMSFFRDWLAEYSSTTSSPSTIPSVRSIRASKVSRNSIDSKLESRERKLSESNVLSQNKNLQSLSRNTHDQMTFKISYSSSPVTRSKPTLHTILPTALLTIGRSTSSAPLYLGHEDCKRFLKLNESLYTRSNLKNFEQRLEELRTLARDVVKPVTESQLSNGSHVNEYLVCIGINSGEWPWENND